MDGCCYQLLSVQESEIVRTWLCELRMEDCWELFDNAGYDMPTISRMTPEVCFPSVFLCAIFTVQWSTSYRWNPLLNSGNISPANYSLVASYTFDALCSRGGGGGRRIPAFYLRDAFQSQTNTDLIR